jgi:hypothetical protein
MGSNLIPFLPLIVIGFAIILLISRIFKFGGFRASMFDASIQSTVGEAIGSGPSSVNCTVTVHVLSSPPEKTVGLEFVAKSFPAIKCSLLPCRNHRQGT